MFDFTNDPEAEAGTEVHVFTPNQQRVLDWLDEGGDDGGRSFRMDTWLTTANPFDVTKEDPFCGSACCIGGYIHSLQFKDYKAYLDTCSTFDSTRMAAGPAAFLGLSNEVGYALFYPCYMTMVKPHHAAQALRNAILRGNPMWDEVMGW